MTLTGRRPPLLAGLLATVLTVASASGQGALADDPTAAPPPFAGLFERSGADLREGRRAGVRAARAVSLRGDLLERIRSGEARPIELPFAPASTLRARVLPPDRVDLGFERWPVVVEPCDDPFCSVLLIASSPRSAPAAVPPSAAPGAVVPPAAGGRSVLMWLRSSRYGNWELFQPSSGGAAVLRELDFSRLGDCAVGGAGDAQARPGAPAGSGRGCRCCRCRCHGTGPGRAGALGGAGDLGADDFDADVVPLPPPGNTTMTTITLLAAYTTWAVYEKAGLAPLLTAGQLDLQDPDVIRLYRDAEEAIQASIVAAVQDLNDVFAKSLIAVRVELVGPAGPYPCPVVHTAVDSCRDTWLSLTTNPDSYQRTLRSTRDQHQADLVCIVAEGGKADEHCGFGSTYDETLPWEERRERCYSVIRSSCLANRTLAHEIGHNLGACHFHGDGGGQGSSPQCWGGDRHPFVFQTWDAREQRQRTFMTLMGRSAWRSDAARVDMFSSADRHVPGIGWMGYANTANNARIVRSSAVDVAQYR